MTTPSERRPWFHTELREAEELKVSLRDAREQTGVSRAVNQDELFVCLLTSQACHMVLVTREAYEKQKSIIDLLIDRFRKQDGASPRTFIATKELIRYVRDNAGRENEPQVQQAESETMRFLMRIVASAAEMGASDIHWSAVDGKCKILYRHDGVVIQSGEPITKERAEELLAAMFNAYSDAGSNEGSVLTFKKNQRAAVTLTLSVHGQATKLTLRFQMAAPALGGWKAVMRIAWQTGSKFQRTKNSMATDLMTMGYLDDQAKLMQLAAMRDAGGFVLAGVTGSGKTTTLYLILSHIATKEKVTYTIEDPIENKLFNVTQLPVEMSMGKSADEVIASMVKTMMRMDPDIAMVAEIRGPETGNAFKELCLTGHFALTTVHASSALGIPTRLAGTEIGIPRDTLAGKEMHSLWVYQKLYRTLCSCALPIREAEHVPGETVEQLDKLIPLDRVKVGRPGGCNACGGTGYKGRTVSAEVLFPSDDMLELLAEGRNRDAERLWRKVRQPLTSPQSLGRTAYENALYKTYLGLIDPMDVKEGEDFELYLIRQPYDRLKGGWL